MNQDLIESVLDPDGDVSGLHQDFFEYEMDDDEELDDLFEALMDDDEEYFDDDDEDEDFSERRRRRRRRSSRRRSKSRKKSCCTDPRVKRDLLGLKRKDRQQDKLIYQNRKRSLANTKINRIQSKNLGRLDRQMKLDGALEFAQSISIADNSLDVDLVRMFQGAVKAGMLGDLRGALGNPALVGGIGLLLRNRQLFTGLVKG